MAKRKDWQQPDPGTAVAILPAGDGGAAAHIEAGKTTAYEWLNVFDQIEDPVFVHDREGRILRCNAAYAACAGLPVAAITGKPYWKIFPKGGGHPLNIRPEAMTSPLSESRLEIMPEHGQLFLTHDITAHHESGEFWYSRHLMKNLTDRKMEEKIGKLAGKLKSSFSEAIIGSAPGVFFVVDQESRLVRWNVELTTLCGRADKALDKALLLSLLPADQQAFTQAKLAEAFATGSAAGELRLQCQVPSPQIWIFSARRFELVTGEPYVACFCLDQTEVRRLENDLQHEKMIADTIIESAPGVFFMLDRQGKLVRWNSALCEETGLSGTQLQGKLLLETIHPADRALAETKFLTAFAMGYAQMEVRVQTPERGLRHFFKSARRFMINEVPYLAGFCFDITDRNQAEEALVREKTFSDALIESTPGVFYVLNGEGNLLRWNSYLNRLTGLTNGELSQRPALLTFMEAERPQAAEAMRQAFEEGCAQLDLRIPSQERGLRLFSMTMRRFQAGDVAYLVGIGIDTTDKLSKLAELEREARTDPLTQVVNRGRFLELAKQEFARCRRYSHPLSLWMLDIDHFKDVNDTYGHHAGDVALQSLVSVSQQALRDWDILGRMGGEEFAVLLPETESAQALLVAERLRQNVANSQVPLTEGKSVHLTVSIGIASAQEGDSDIEALLERADQALYAAKRTGRDKVIQAKQPALA